MDKTFEQMKKDAYFDGLVTKAKEFVRRGRLYGYEIDIDNPRDVIAALYCAYTTKEMMVQDNTVRYVQIHQR